jgi:hypothetical protein
LNTVMNLGAQKCGELLFHTCANNCSLK